MDTQLTPFEIQTHNKLSDRAWDCLKDNIILDGVPTSPLGFFRRRRVRLGIKLFLQVLQLNPTNWSAMFGIGKAYQALNELAEALNWFERALATDPMNSSLAKEVGGTAGRLGQYAKAIAAMERIHVANRDPSLHSNLGVSYLLNGRAKDAEESFRQAVEGEPNNSTTKNLLRLAEDVAALRRPCPQSESQIIEMISR